MNKNNAILITGCSTGIGHCLARGLQTRGYHVIASCRNPDDLPVLAEIGLDTVVLDLDDPESIGNGLAKTLELTNGKLFGLINNGAYGQPGAVEDLPRTSLRAQFETNVFGTQELTNRVIPIMRQNNTGRIIQISSVLGFVSLKYRGAYNASKYALEGLTDTMRLELAGSGIELSLIEPGPITSEFRVNSLHKFIEHIDRSHSVHQAEYQELEKRLKSDRPTRYTLPPEAVLEATIQALESPRPRIRYRVTTPTKVLAVLKRILTDRMLDNYLLKR